MTDRLCNLKKHLKKKRSCESKFSTLSRELLLLNLDNSTREYITETKNMFACRYCKKTYKSRSSKYRHQKICKKKKEFEERFDKERRTEILINKLSIQVKKLMEEKKMENDTNKQTTTHITTQNIQQINNQQINNHQINNIDNSKNIQINNYGEEDLSHITDNEYKEMLESPFNAMTKLMNAIHFNKNKPENNNLRIPNVKLPFAKIFKDGEWVFSNQYKLLCKAYSVKKEILHKAFLRIESQLDEKTKRIYYEYRQAANDDLFTVQSQLTDIKAAIISGTRTNTPILSKYALRQTCCPKKQLYSF